jgi:protein NrfD
MENPLFFWDWRMVLHLYFGGLGVGAFAFGALLFHLNSDRYRLLITRLLQLGPAAVLMGFFFLLLGLKGGVGNLLDFMAQNPGSDVTIGLLLQIAFLVMAARVIPQVRRNYAGLNAAVLIVMALIGVAIALFHGALLLWAELDFWPRPLVGVMLASALSGGVLGGWMLTRRPFGRLAEAKADEYTTNQPLVGVALLAGLGVLSFLWMHTLTEAEVLGQLALLYLMEERTFWLFGVGFGVGIFLPLTLLSGQLFWRKREPGRWITHISGASVLLGTLVLKWLIVYLGKGL